MSVVEAIKTAIKLDKPVILTGRPGVGKSTMVKQAVRELENCELIADIRLSNFEPTDIIARIPIGDKLKSVLVDQFDHILTTAKNNPDTIYVILFDEIDKAMPPVQKMVYQILLDRKIDIFEIPKNIRFVAAQNLSEDSIDSYNIMEEKPLWDRFVFRIKVEPNHEEWIDWAIEHELDTRVISYLNYNESDLYVDEGEALITPRRWENVSDILKSIESSESIEILQYVIGKETFNKFSAFLSLINKYDIETLVESGKAPESIEEQYALIEPIVSYIRNNMIEENWNKIEKLKPLFKGDHRVMAEVSMLVAKLINKKYQVDKNNGIVWKIPLDTKILDIIYNPL